MQPFYHKPQVTTILVQEKERKKSIIGGVSSTSLMESKNPHIILVEPELTAGGAEPLGEPDDMSMS